MSTSRFVEWKIHSGEAIQFGNRTVTPLSQALVVRLPHHGFVWNRPIGIRIADETGSRTIPIVDVTRTAQIGLLALGFLFTSVGWLVGRRKAGKE